MSTDESEPLGGALGVSRRQALRLGAAVGGAAWVAPVVTALGIDSAAAAQPSGVGEGRGNGGAARNGRGSGRGLGLGRS